MRNKRFVSILSSVVSLVLGFTLFMIHKGHVDKAMKMHEQLASSMREMNAMLSELISAGTEGGMPQMLSAARSNQTRAAEAAKKMREVCDYFEKVKVPSSLKSELSAVRKGIPEMRRFIDSFEGLFGSVMIESEFMNAVEALGKNTEQLVETDGFARAEASFISELERIRYRKGFIWL